MSASEFGILQDIELREAWKHEARDFTPWLAKNLSSLGEALGLELELVEAEAGLPSQDDEFAADILAQNVRDGTAVLIENQLEISDHGHLGQIMTYLAGLEAHTIIWIAPQFREAHLSAVKWLNENTTEGFAFFAVRVRVVRIGESPLAPLFEVLEKPNDWERSKQAAARAVRATAPRGDERRRFWAYFFKAYPANAIDGEADGASNKWRRCAGGKFNVSYYLAKENVGVFIRGPRGVSDEQLAELLSPYETVLRERLGFTAAEPASVGLSQWFACNYGDETQWPSIAKWLDEKVRLYEQALNAAVTEQ